MKLIDKDAVVSWVTEKREAALYRQHNLERIGQETYVNQMIADNLGRMLSFLDTLEVKEMDLDTDFGVCWGEYCDCGGNINDYKFAKHFFELGLKAQKGE